MTVEPPITLREVARQLGTIRGRDKPDVPELLRLLKSGELKAGFEFPGTNVSWIPIPTGYWTGISSYKFGSLRYVEGDKRKTGTYEVRISDGFIDEYLQGIRQQLQGMAPDLADPKLYEEFRKALSAAANRYEVAITSEEWAKFVDRQPMPTPTTQQPRSSSGRREKTSWHHLAPIMAAYLMTLDDRPRESRDHGSIAANILELAVREGIRDLPATDTLRDVIAKAFDRARAL
jgi:hypothetical protein